MTSSLVGSEMCIRDSSRMAGRNLRHLCNIGYYNHSCQRRPSMCAHEDPVSYTHLTLPTICSV
eukprot:1700188-Prorocentrum_lima.AAC.1